MHAPLKKQGSSDCELQGNPHLLLSGPRDSPAEATHSNSAHASLWAIEESCEGDPEQAGVSSLGPKGYAASVLPEEPRVPPYLGWQGHMVNYILEGSRSSQEVTHRGTVHILPPLSASEADN